MELRKPKNPAEQGPPTLAPVIPLSVKVVRPNAPAPRTRSRLRADTFFTRVLAGSLLISLPLMVILGVLMYSQGLQLSAQEIRLQTRASATTTADRIEQWISKSQDYLTQLAREAAAPAGRRGPIGIPLENAFDPAFKGMAVVDAAGTVIATTTADPDLKAVGRAPWFGQALYIATEHPIGTGTTGLVWIITAPIVGANGVSQGAVAGDLNVAELSGLLGSVAPEQEVHVANSDHLLVISSDWGHSVSDSGMGAKGAFITKVEVGVVNLALTAGAGSLQITDYRNRDVFAGYAPIDSSEMVVVDSTDVAAGLAPAYALGHLTLVILLIGTLLVVGFAVLLARLAIRPITVLSRVAARVEAGDLTARVKLTGGSEMRILGAAFNGMLQRLSVVLSRLQGEVADSSTKLSTAAEELAAATFEQTTAATATSASMEELARTTVSMADTMNRVAAQSADARSSLELAQTDLRSSGDRTMALAGRVNEIEGILELINDIADQTNLLALNAAIEAARAGDAGRGFAVVADEVRRLAERSKAAAAQIATIVEGAQTQSGETVMALEKSIKQMERGLSLMEDVAKAGGQMNAAHQQQRASTDQVGLAIERIAEGSRSVAITAQEIASAAARQGELAAELAASGWEHTKDPVNGA
ncbi:MAG TPA: methyl-accepting chemotaxis protein [Candidatus Dormibacteraeota bacterium]